MAISGTNECLRQIAAIGGGLDLRSLTSIPEGLKLPESIGGGLDLSSLTSIPEGLKNHPKIRQ